MKENIQLKDETKIITLDVFDTLLLRNTKPELKRFEELSELNKIIFKKSGKYFSKNEIFHARVMSHYITYKTNLMKNKERNANIEDIFSLMLYILNIKNKKLIKKLLECEISYEIKNLKFNKKLAKIINEIRKNKNIRLCLLSDMYLSKSAISEIIRFFSRDFDYDDLYVSSEIKKTKFSGELYEIFLKKEKCNPCEIIHIGNDYYSDYLIPINKQITCVYMPRSKLFNTLSRINEKIYHILINDKGLIYG